MKTFRIFLLLLVSLFQVLGMLAAEPESPTSIFDFWQAQGLQEITLRLDLNEVERNRRTENSMQAELEAAGHTFAVKYEIGGRFRRINCEIPPLRLHLNKEGLSKLGFESFNDFKLVTHCQGDAASQDAVLREALAYDLYRVLAPVAFRSRVVKVNYINTADGSSITAYGLLIEDTDELKARNNLRSVKQVYNQPLEAFENAELVSLFQYMIGNADYSLQMQRNVKLFTGTNGRIVAVPYDFDYSGFVNPSYAKPNPDIGQRKVTDRVWMWHYETEGSLKGARRLLLDKRTELLETVANSPYLSADSKKEVSQYLKAFFTELRNGQIGIAAAR